MKSTQLSSSKLELRLAAYAAAGVALAAPALSTTAQASIVYSGPLTLAVPQTGIGIYLDLATGATSTTGGFVGYDINVYGTTTVNFFMLTSTTLESTSTILPPSALTFGTPVGPTAIFSTNGTATNFRIAGTEYLGLRFTNTTTNAVNYGWLQLLTGGASTGLPATILGYAYDNTGAGLTAGQTAVPEPGATAALAMGALSLGAVGVRRWRQAKQAVA